MSKIPPLEIYFFDLRKWFPDISMYMNHPSNELNCRFLITTLRFKFNRSGVVARNLDYEQMPPVVLVCLCLVKQLRHFLFQLFSFKRRHAG